MKCSLCAAANSDYPDPDGRGGVQQKMGGLNLKSQKESWGGSFLIKLTNFYLPYFGIMLEGGS